MIFLFFLITLLEVNATGNEGTSMERWYHRTALIFWPKSLNFQTLQSMSPTILYNQIMVN